MISYLLSSDGGSTTANYGTYIILGVVLVAFIVMFITSSRSNKKRQKEMQDKLDNVKVGDRIKTIGGICGVIEEIDSEDNTFVLRTGGEGESCLLKFDKVAIYQTEPAVTASSSDEKEEDAKSDKDNDKAE